MAAIVEIPLTPVPQKFLIVLSGVTYKLIFQWRDADMGGWFLDMHDEQDNPIASGLPLITGADVLGQFDYLGLAGHIMVMTDGDPGMVPSFTTLGTISHVYWIAD